MKIIRILTTTFLLVIIATTFAAGDSKNPADYPLRLHIIGVSQMTFYHNRMTDEVRGDGRGNLFENGMARGVDFSYDCSDKIKPSFGFETYPAKWKKQGKELVVLFPVFGKTGAYFTCTIKTDVKDYTYVRMRDGRIGSDTPERYKDWMQKHDYDPEHGKDKPVLPPPPTAQPQAVQPQVPPKN